MRVSSFFVTLIFLIIFSCSLPMAAQQTSAADAGADPIELHRGADHFKWEASHQHHWGDVRSVR